MARRAGEGQGTSPPRFLLSPSQQIPVGPDGGGGGWGVGVGGKGGGICSSQREAWLLLCFPVWVSSLLSKSLICPSILSQLKPSPVSNSLDCWVPDAPWLSWRKHFPSQPLHPAAPALPTAAVSRRNRGGQGPGSTSGGFQVERVPIPQHHPSPLHLQGKILVPRCQEQLPAVSSHWLALVSPFFSALAPILLLMLFPVWYE